MTLARSKITPDAIRRKSFRKLLAKQLHKDEIKIVFAVLDCERDSKVFRAGRLGLAESLVRRRWLRRDPATGAVTLSEETRSLLAKGAP